MAPQIRSESTYCYLSFVAVIVIGNIWELMQVKH